MKGKIKHWVGKVDFIVKYGYPYPIGEFPYEKHPDLFEPVYEISEAPPGILQFYGWGHDGNIGYYELPSLFWVDGKVDYKEWVLDHFLQGHIINKIIDSNCETWSVKEKILVCNHETTIKEFKYEGGMWAAVHDYGTTIYTWFRKIKKDQCKGLVPWEEVDKIRKAWEDDRIMGGEFREKLDALINKYRT